MSSTNNTVNTIIHDLFLVAVTAASIFVKNPNSQQHAATLISLANGLLTQLAPTTESMDHPPPAS